MPALLKAASYGRGAFKRTAVGFTGKQLNSGLKFPPGLTFYKKFSTAIKCKLNANYSLGSPIFTYTSTSGLFTISGGGYSSTTANADVLKYLIAGNRTAAQETIVIKFTPTGDFANDGVIRHILDADADRITLRKNTTGTKAVFYPNLTDNSSSATTPDKTLLSGVSYLICAISYGATTDMNSQVFINGIADGHDHTDYLQPTLGTSFYIGSSNAGVTQLNGVFYSVAIFNRVLSESEILALNGLM